MAALAVGGAGYHLETRQERKFKNKFGDIIYEEILHLVPTCESDILGDEFARSVASWFLLKASQSAADEQVGMEALEAKEHARDIPKSPLFNPTSHPNKVSGKSINNYIRQLLSNEPLDEETVLDRGYF